jgi:prepilin-type N-terminal cleavage/methylation domain-containing protein
MRTDRQQGFTLLEVMVALTISAMILGGLFALAAGSKQLALRAQDSLQLSTSNRAVINFALLDNEFRDIEAVLDDSRYQIRAVDVLPDVERRTAPMNDLLQAYEVIDNQTGEVINGVRWIRFDLPQ